MNETYTIKEVADMFDLTVSTIHYYDKQGLLPFVSKNEAGYRVFTTADLNFIKTICCLKNTEMPIKEIKQYIEYCMQGTDSIANRKLLLNQHRKRVLAKQALLTENLQEIDYKLNRYNDPKATELVAEQIDYTINEKQLHHLNNPFK